MIVAKLQLLCFMIKIINVFSHGTMVLPNNWFDREKWQSSTEFGFVGMKPGKQCGAGCDYRGDEVCPHEPQYCMRQNPGCSCFWHNNHTYIEKQTIFDKNLRTYFYNEYPSFVAKNPWLSPGSAPLDSPCGVGGGNIHGCQGDCRQQGGYPYGPKAEEFFNSRRGNYKVTEWIMGSIMEVVWSISANHGGGYAYRLCKVPEEGIIGVTEECFQNNHLNLCGSSSWAQYGEDVTTRFEFPAVRTNQGTTPKGSQWTKNPIPACKGISGGFFSKQSCPKGTQFKPPRSDLKGYGVNIYHNETFNFSIIDKVKVPTDISEGEYVLSFRWDCEQTAQVWNTCASVYIKQN